MQARGVQGNTGQGKYCAIAQWEHFSVCPGNRPAVDGMERGLAFLFYLVFYGFFAALSSFTKWAALQTPNEEGPAYHDHSPSAGLEVFPKTATALPYTFSVSDPSSCEGHIKDLTKFLKSYSLEEQKKKNKKKNKKNPRRISPILLMVSFLNRRV